MTEAMKKEKRSEERHIHDTTVAFHAENDLYIARSVDISGRGIRIVTENPINISFQIKEDDKLMQYNAQLVWARLKDDGSMEYGLKY